jgi:hypothetical protein
VIGRRLKRDGGYGRDHLAFDRGLRYTLPKAAAGADGPKVRHETAPPGGKLLLLKNGGIAEPAEGAAPLGTPTAPRRSAGL